MIIIMGSSGDEEFTKPICITLKKLGLPYELRVSSAHKTPYGLLKMLEEYESSMDRIVYITVAGRSNALSGFVDANTKYPVIACPPQSEKFGGADIYSSLRMPSGVSPLVVLEPENAAFAAAKILALANSELCETVLDYQQDVKNKTVLDDEKVRKTKD
ncbi:MAG: AIR carboxylase family protein [Candidatus Bathyarchaeota archaeon]